jgi:hypothetical protein
VTSPPSADTLGQAVPDDVAPGDSTVVGVPPSTADTLSLGAPVTSDSVAVPDSVTVPAFTLRDYLTALSERYPGTAYAARAQEMVQTLPAPAEPAPDTTGATTPADAFGGFAGSSPIDLSLGGVSWQVGPFASQADAEAGLAALPARFLRTAVATDGVSFVVLLGHFADEAAATEAAATADPALILGASVVPVEGLALVAPPEAATEPEVPLPGPPPAPPPGTAPAPQSE